MVRPSFASDRPSRDRSDRTFRSIELNAFSFRMTATTRHRGLEARNTAKIEETGEGSRRAVERIVDDILGAVFVAMLLIWIVSAFLAPISKVVPAKVLARHPGLSYLELGPQPEAFGLLNKRHDDTVDEALRGRIAKSRLTLGKWTREENTPLSLRPFPVRIMTNGVSRRWPAHFSSHEMFITAMTLSRHRDD